MGRSNRPVDPGWTPDEEFWYQPRRATRRPAVPVRWQYAAVALAAFGFSATTLLIAAHTGERRPVRRLPAAPVERVHPVAGSTQRGTLPGGVRGPQTVGSQVATTTQSTSVTVTLDETGDGGVCLSLLEEDSAPTGPPVCFPEPGQTRVIVPNLAAGSRFRLAWYRPGPEGKDCSWSGRLRFSGGMTDGA
ncbi:hypothetical protein GCM10022223_05260 [Kineosporia mesophila]|uniref:Uncharacterized protein n=1 Tax=Kineosporia mesophila TaxID=566012 RepID=A0ABP6Z029_9ACTN|nr:hypothetical protein [Kineosporia mesophila]MCD5354265.1 hypothetical protein [Kineosporia mesophila]